MREGSIGSVIGPSLARLDRRAAAMRDRGQNRKGRARGPALSRRLRLTGCYQVPPLVAEQPPLSAEPVEQLRDVVPPALRVSVNVAAFESRLDTTLTV